MSFVRVNTIAPCPGILMENATQLPLQIVMYSLSCILYLNFHGQAGQITGQ